MPKNIPSLKPIVFKILKDGEVYFMEIGSHDICY